MNIYYASSLHNTDWAARQFAEYPQVIPVKVVLVEEHKLAVEALEAWDAWNKCLPGCDIDKAEKLTALALKASQVKP